MKYIELPAGTIKRIHVHRANIARNAKDGKKRPQWIVQTSRGPISCHKVAGTVFIGSGPDDPQLSCGARLYLTTRASLSIFINPKPSEWLTRRARELIK